MPDPDLEWLRDSGLRLDREGRWWHEGQQVLHERLARALHRWLDRLEDGRYVVRVAPDRYAFVEVEDAPFRVLRLQIEPQGMVVELSDGTHEPLDGGSLTVGRDDAFYCRVHHGRFEARFSRGAHNTLGALVDHDGSGFVIRHGARVWPIGPRR